MSAVEQELDRLRRRVSELEAQSAEVEALERRVVHMALLDDIGQRIAATLDLDSLLQRAVRLTQESFGHHHVGLFLLDEERGGLTMQARAGAYAQLYPPDHHTRLGQGMVGWTGLHGETLLANDVSLEPRYINPFPDAVPTRSEVSVPIRAGEVVLGVLDVQSPALKAFNDDDLMVLETLANQIAVAMDNARLYRSLQRELEERRQAEARRELALAAMRESEERFALAIDATRDGLWDWHVPSGQAYFSPHYYTMLGYEPYEMPGGYETWRSLVHPDDLEAAQQYVRHSLEHAEGFEFEFRARTRDGGWRWILSRGKVVERDAAGRPVRAVGTHTDITERKSAQQSLARQADHLEALRQASLVLTSSLDVDWILDQLLEQIGRVVPYDGAMLLRVESGVAHVTHLRGYQVAGAAEAAAALRIPVAGSPSLRRLAGARRPHVISDTWADPAWNRLPGMEWIRSWAGAPILIGNELVALFGLDSATPGFYTAEHAELLAAFASHAVIAMQNAALFSQAQVAYDNLKQAQAQLIQSAKMAAIGELAAGVAHELNNPLTSILGFAELAMHSLAAEHPACDDLAVVLAESQRARDIVRGMLDFARQTESAHTSTSLNKTVQDAVGLVRHQLDKEGIILAEDYAPDLPPMLLSPGRMTQVFLNLITNAVKAMSRGDRLSIATARLDNHAVVRVSDTGIGISDANLPRIFEPFFTTRPAGQGTGLGLPVSLGIVQEHGGGIDVESQEGRGSTFTVSLPLFVGSE